MAMLDHWANVADEHEKVLEFVGWLHDEYNIRLDYDFVSKDKPAPLELRKLVDEFFEVDRAQLESERRQLMDSMKQTT